MERGWEADSIIWNSCISACKKGSQQLGLAALQKAQIADPACVSSCCCCFLSLVNWLHICKECCRFVFCSGICRATWLNYSVIIAYIYMCYTYRLGTCLSPTFSKTSVTY